MMSERHLESFLRDTRSLVMRAYTLRPAWAFTVRAAGWLATRPVARAARMERAEDIVSKCVRECGGRGRVCGSYGVEAGAAA